MGPADREGCNLDVVAPALAQYAYIGATGLYNEQLHAGVLDGNWDQAVMRAVFGRPLIKAMSANLGNGTLGRLVYPTFYPDSTK